MAATATSTPASSSTATMTSTSSDERTMALLIHVLGIFTWFVGPLILWLIKKDQSAFIDRHGKEQLNLQITATIGYVVGGILTLIIIGIFLIWAVSIAVLIFCILAAIQANKGNDYRFPFAIRFLK